MTPFAGLIAAVIAAFMLKEPRRTVLAMAGPWLAVLAFQTWGIGSGRGVSPPDTVSQASYWVVQVIILAFVLGVAVQLALLLAPRRPVDRTRAERSRDLVRATALCTVGLAAFVYLGFGTFLRSVIDPGSVAHHSSEGNPPIAGIVGLLGMVLGCAVLGALLLRQRRARRAATTAPAPFSAVP